MKLKTVLFFIATLCCFQQLRAYQLQDVYIGNWINRSTNNWDYGFFEQFAIYRNGFWNYESIVSDKRGTINIVLTKGNERINLTLKPSKDSLLSIQNGSGKALKFTKMGLTYPNYPQKDASFFAKPTFRQDTVTLIGYIRNREKIPQEFKTRLVVNPFVVSVTNVLTDKEDKYFADFDSLGRFELRFPITNMQQVYVDWSRLHMLASFEAGDTTFLFADLMDFIPLQKDGSYDGYYKRPKQVLFSGDNARLNNELFTFKPSSLYTDRNRGERVSDSEFLTHCDSVYKARLQVLNGYEDSHPMLSEKFKAVQAEYERFQLLSDMMQHRFDVRRKGNVQLDSAYVAFVAKMAPLDREWLYTAFREFRWFLRDWVGYHEDVRGNKSVQISFKEIAAHVKAKNAVSAETLTLLNQLAEMNDAFEKAKPEDASALQQTYKPLLDKAQSLNALFTQAATEIVSARPKPTSVSDSLFKNENLRRIWNAQSFYRIMDQSHLPLKPEQLTSMRSQVVHPSMVEQLESIHRFYETVAKTGMTYAASLKNTENLKEYKDAKALFEELIKPYKGKVIYVDFWGTWCGPCKENMRYVKGLKEKLQGMPIVYMYFANRSPEDSWKSILKEMDLTGENVVHYRLPEEQEAMIERLFDVNKFPTYMLINKEGQVVNTDALSPIQKEATLNQIVKMF